MKYDQSTEDYLETILVLSQNAAEVHQIDVAKRMGVSQPAVNKAVRKLKDSGYVRTEGMHIFLTEEGAARASGVYDMHCDLRSFLLLLGVSEETAEADACKLEHVIGDETYAAIRRFLGK